MFSLFSVRSSDISMTDRSNNGAHQAFLLTLLVALLIFFACYVAYDLGILSRIIMDDSTYISVVILTLFAVTLCHCVWRGWVISKQTELFCSLRHQDVQTDTLSTSLSAFGPTSLPPSLQIRFPDGVSYAQDYLAYNYNVNSETNPEASVDAEVLAEKLRGPNQVGWFCTGLMIKFGLLGTVIGFAIMLSSVNSLEALEVSDIKNLMQQMTQGMRVAMNTTILGLISSMLLGLQYLTLDRFADGLVVDILAESASLKR